MVPLLVTVVGGNAVTAAAVLGCLNTADANALRRLHPVFAAHVAAIAWADSTTNVYNTVLWRAMFPAAVACKPCSVTGTTTTGIGAGTWFVVERPVQLEGASLAALRGVTVLNLESSVINDAVVAALPPTLQHLSVSGCRRLTQCVSFTHLPALEALDCSATNVKLDNLPPTLRELVCTPSKAADFCHLRSLRMLKCFALCDTRSVATLPPSLEELDVRCCTWPRDWSAAHLTRLAVLRANNCDFYAAALATLRPSLRILDLQTCKFLSCGASFAHLTNLHTLSLRCTNVLDEALATLPPSLVSLDLAGSTFVTEHAVFPRLPALRVLNVLGTCLSGHATVASLTRGLEYR